MEAVAVASQTELNWRQGCGAMATRARGGFVCWRRNQQREPTYWERLRKSALILSDDGVDDELTTTTTTTTKTIILSLSLSLKRLKYGSVSIDKPCYFCLVCFCTLVSISMCVWFWYLNLCQSVRPSVCLFWPNTLHCASEEIRLSSP